MIKRIESLSNTLEVLAEKIVIITFSVMVLSVLLSVLTRNIAFPITWLEELSRYMQIWFVNVGFALALKKGMLSGSEVILKKIPEKFASRIIIVSKIIMALLCLVMLVSSAELIKHLFKSMQLSANMKVPIVLVYIGIYAGFLLSLVFLITSIAVNLDNRKDGIDKMFEPVREDEIESVDRSLVEKLS